MPNDPMIPADQGLSAGSGPHHLVMLRPGAQVLYVAFGTTAPSAADAAAEGASIVQLSAHESEFGNGVPGFADSLDELFCRLRGLEIEGAIRLVGEGAGASLAILAGLMLPGASVLAVNPVPIAGWTGAVRHPFWGNAAAIASAHPSRQNGVTAMSAWDPAAAAVLAEPNALPPAFGTVVELPCRGSGVAYLRRKGALATLLARSTESLRDLRAEGVLGSRNTHGHMSQYAAFSQATAALSAGSSGRKVALRLVEAEAAWMNPGWQFLRSGVLRREGMLPEALTAARVAVEGAPEAPEFCVGYARLVKEADAHDERAKAATLLTPHLRQRGIAALQESLSCAV